jgi:glycosyltransferase involved in cell wall biosynthesis
MPAYRSETTVREAVESVLAQTVPELELLVIDDAGPEPVAAALAGIEDPRLGIFRHARNHTTAGARNTAVALARAPLVSQLDADDAWEPGYLEAVLPAFEDPAVGLAYANAHVVGHPHGLDDYIGDPSVHPMDRFPKLAEQCPVPSLTATIRTAAVRSAGGYSESLWGTSDYDLYVRLAARGWRFAYVHRRLARYRWPTATSKSANRRRIERSLLLMWLRFVVRHPLTPGPRRQVRTRAGDELRLLRARLGSSSP